MTFINKKSNPFDFDPNEHILTIRRRDAYLSTGQGIAVARMRKNIHEAAWVKVPTYKVPDEVLCFSSLHAVVPSHKMNVGPHGAKVSYKVPLDMLRGKFRVNQAVKRLRKLLGKPDRPMKLSPGEIEELIAIIENSERSALDKLALAGLLAFAIENFSDVDLLQSFKEE